MHARLDLLSARTCLFALLLTRCAGEPEHPPWQCNVDFVCDTDENQRVCPSDCVSSEAAGQGSAAAVCDAQENWTFVQACLVTCGNNQKDEDETVETCPRDFPGLGCGDGVCAPLEDPARCPTECHPGSCGDGTCELHENAAVCPGDCTPGCGDGVCQADEEGACPRDCESCPGDSCVCGDMVCGASESMMSCPEDCTEPNCGNGVKEGSEACDDGNAADSDACTNTCKVAACGDGIVWAGEEQCDDGPDNGSGKACNELCQASACGDGEVGPGETCDDGNDDDSDDCAACQVAACGDGFTWAGEEVCDDGNDIDTDDCTSACEPAGCGDGIVWEGMEECDDENLVDTDACTNECMKPRRVIFVTSEKFVGDLMGLSGADGKCAAAVTALEPLKGKSFKAWLSSSSSWPAKRLDTQYQGMYVLTDGTVIAENGWADLTDGELLHAIDLSETKMLVNATPWTNTRTDGTSAGTIHCESWTEKAPEYFGAFGRTDLADASWTEAMGMNSCSGAFPLYCIEDP
ncbi:DUF4215 domain-containing protein [Nannocystis pusilla]|uniref:DUF4215 domain-containing protein n=1 Tax=Nannocystis pusilla TaxID=889268 RepID=UPI003DA2E0DC